MSDPSEVPPDDPALPVSMRVRDRLRRAGRRFNANDNIADFLEPGELEALLERGRGKMQGVLESLVIDIENDHNTQRHRPPRRQDVPERGVPRALCRRRRRRPSFPTPRASTS